MIALDTNLLVYAHRESVSEHSAAKRAIERASRDSGGWGIAVSSVSEFWMAVTHRAAEGGPSRPSQAQAFLMALFTDGPGVVWTPGEHFATRLTQLASDLEVMGLRVFDLQIALTAFDRGATEIWTHDRDFTAFPGMRVVDPL